MGDFIFASMMLVGFVLLGLFQWYQDRRYARILTYAHCAKCGKAIRFRDSFMRRNTGETFCLECALPGRPMGK